ncbi:MAG: tRNA (guanosine(37)-N1)-methyltransferase TrmD [Pseudomonadota bacterium]|nr:tRNA (guanosine(37)-N1)-methyltransferase TrmD [Pseudomonadota bacterium]
MASALRIDVLTLFPELIEHAVRFGVTGRAHDRGLWQLGTWNPREYAAGSYRNVDDRPYGGGPGMVMLREPLTKALASARAAQREAGFVAGHTIYLSPAGAPLTHARVAELAAGGGAYVLVAGRYEGIDERFIEAEVQEEIAVGSFVVSGGEFPALMLIDAMVRLLPGALNDEESARQDSFAEGLLDCPHYTRPENDGAQGVPPVLLSGDHAAIRRWRLKQALGRTWERRPELLASRGMSDQERALLAEYQSERSFGSGTNQGLDAKGADDRP